jgi:anti-anti-sigma factor
MTYEEVGTATVYRVAVSRLFSSEDVQTLRNGLQSVVERSARPLVAVDFSSLEFISSRGLGVLVAMHKSIRAKQGGIVLFGASPAIQHVLSTTKIDSLVPVVADEEQALAALGKTRA